MSAIKFKYPKITDENGKRTVGDFFHYAKYRFIHMCYEYSKHFYCSSFFSSLLLTISYLQIYAQIFDSSIIPRIEEDWGPFSFMATIMDIFRLSPHTGGGMSYGVTLVFVYVLCTLTFLFILSFYYMHMSINIKKLYFIMPIELACLYSEILFWILLIPICETYVGVYFCDNGFSELLEDIECLSNEHTIYIIVFTIGLLLHICSFYVIALFFNESRPYGESGFSRLDLNSEVYFCTYRIVTSLVGKLLIKNNLTWALIALHSLYAIISVYKYYRYIPYYNKTVSSIYGGCIVLHIWQLLNVILYYIMGGSNEPDDSRLYKGIAVVTFVGAVVTFVGAWELRQQLIRRKIIESRYKGFTNDGDIDLHVQSLLGLYTSQLVIPADELLLRGVLSRHIAECINIECPLQKDEKLYHPATDTESGTDKTDSKDKIIILALINEILKNREKDSKLNDQIDACFHLIYANYLLKELGNVHMTIVEILKAQRSSPSLQEEVSIYKLLRSVENYLAKTYKKKPGDKLNHKKGNNSELVNIVEYLDASIVIKFENWLVQLIKITEKCAGDHIEFWGHLESATPDLNELNRIGLTILTNTKEIIRIWKKISKINENHPKALYTYGHYLRDIKNDIVKGQEYIERADAMFQHKSSVGDFDNDFKVMFATDTAIIVIDGSPEHLGKIIKTNSGIFKLLAYHPFEIYGNDVSILMPELFATNHQKFMQHYFATGKQYMIQHERLLFALHKQGYIFCVSIIIKPICSLINAVPQYIGMIRHVLDDFDFIITDKHGKIDAVSLKIYQMYNISHAFIKNNQIYIHLICPELADPVLGSDQKLRLKFDHLHGKQKIRFFIPKDFQELASQFFHSYKDSQSPTPLESNPDIDEPASVMDLMNSSVFFNHIYKVYKDNKEGKKANFERDNIIYECLNYTKSDVKSTASCEVTDMTFAGMLSIKVFKFYNTRTAKRKNSIENYYVKEGDAQIPANSSKKQNLTKRKGTDTPRKSRFAEDIKGDTQKKVQKQENETQGGSSKYMKILIPTQSDVITIENFLCENREPKLEERKEHGSGLIPTRLTSNFLDLISYGASDLRLLTGSGNSDSLFFSNAEEEKQHKPIEARQREDKLIIKHVDVGQNDQIRKDFQRKRSTVENKDEKEEKKEENTELRRQGSFKSEASEMRHAEKRRREAERKEMEKGELASISTTTHTFNRVIQSLQTALVEIYTPPTIVNLRLTACGILIVLLILTVIGFIMARVVYSQLDSNLDYIHRSTDRTTSIANIAGFTRILTTLSCYDPDNVPCVDVSIYDENTDGIQYLFEEEPMKYLDWVLINIETYTSILKESQRILHKVRNKFKSDNVELVNPSNILIYQLPISESSTNYTHTDCSGSIDSIVVHALEARTNYISFGKDWLNISNNSVNFVLVNALNNILIRLENSLDALLDEAKTISRYNQNTLLIFLLSINVALIVTIFIIMPIVVKIRRDQQNLLCMFLEVPINKARIQLEKCHSFCKMIHDEDGVEEQNLDEENEEKKSNEDTDLLLDTNNELGSSKGHSKKKRKFKSYSSGILMLIIESVIVLSVLESFFLYAVLRAIWFKKTTSHLMNEVVTISNRIIANELYYWIELELITTNGTSRVMNQLVEDYIDIYNRKILVDQEYFLQVHSSNSPYNSDDYKTMFDYMIYSDVCSMIFNSNDTDNIKLCQNYMDGVLKKGLNSANVAFWDALKEIGLDFKRPNERNIDLQNSLLTDPRLTRNHWLLYRYFTRAYNQLHNGLRDSMLKLFKFERKILVIVFSIYIFLLFFIYIGFTKVFVENTKDSLWVTKSLLTILPPDVILQVSKIKQFVMATSKSAIYGIRND